MAVPESHNRKSSLRHVLSITAMKGWPIAGYLLVHIRVDIAIRQQPNGQKLPSGSLANAPDTTAATTTTPMGRGLVLASCDYVTDREKNGGCILQ